MINFAPEDGVAPEATATFSGGFFNLFVEMDYKPLIIGADRFEIYNGSQSIAAGVSSSSGTLVNSTTNHLGNGISNALLPGVPLVYTVSFDDLQDEWAPVTLIYTAFLYDTTVAGFGTDGRDFLYGTDVENKLYGLGAADGIDGGGGNDQLYGGTGDDILQGGLGNDRLDGGTGADLMQGGAGNDIYIIDDVRDQVDESAAGSDGRDTIISRLSVNLLGPAVTGDIEVIHLLGSAAINATGNALANIITGNAANNVLNGGTGADDMAGGKGNDIYFIDNVGDVVDETGGNGADTVRSSLLSIDLTDTSQFHGAIERAALQGRLSLNIIGNELNNILTGNAALNLIIGGNGNDRLEGGLGNDILQGGAGGDSFVFDFDRAGPANVDTILDFAAGIDNILLSKDVMTALGDISGPLGGSQFWASTTGVAHDASDRILYETDTGKLYYDPDGNGLLARKAFAVVIGAPLLQSGDFDIF